MLVVGSCAGQTAAPGVGAAAPRSPASLGPESSPGQRLYRAEYAGPEGSGSLRLTLWLQDPDHFRLGAADRLGRNLWTLQVSGERLLWIDHRQETYCWTAPEVTLPGWEQGPVPLRRLPAVLLGDWPVAGLGKTAPPLTDEPELIDRQGRRWTGRMAEGRLVSWTLWREGEPIWWWQRDGEDGGILSQRGESRQLRWRAVVAEPLARPLGAPNPPTGYQEGCHDGEDPLP